jgi:hypothetical protein
MQDEGKRIVTGREAFLVFFLIADLDLEPRCCYSTDFVFFA